MMAACRATRSRTLAKPTADTVTVLGTARALLRVLPDL
jgi:hypothetical protein